MVIDESWEDVKSASGEGGCIVVACSDSIESIGSWAGEETHFDDEE